MYLAPFLKRRLDFVIQVCHNGSLNEEEKPVSIFILIIVAGIGVMFGITLGVNHERRDWNRVARMGKDAPPLRHKRYI